MADLPDDMFDDLVGRVSAGAALLDERIPDWRDRVDPAFLEMNNCHRCICGQLFADIAKRFDYANGYEYGVFNLFGVGLLGNRHRFQVARDLGFDLPTEYALKDEYIKWAREAWEALVDLWTKEIQR